MSKKKRDITDLSGKQLADEILLNAFAELEVANERIRIFSSLFSWNDRLTSKEDSDAYSVLYYRLLRDVNWHQTRALALAVKYRRPDDKRVQALAKAKLKSFRTECTDYLPEDLRTDFSKLNQEEKEIIQARIESATLPPTRFDFVE